MGRGPGRRYQEALCQGPGSSQSPDVWREHIGRQEKDPRMKTRDFHLTEEELGEFVRDACAKLGWRVLWLRKTYNSSAGILDLLLIPVRSSRQHILHRELKGYDKRGRLGKLTSEQVATIDAINSAGGDAG